MLAQAIDLANWELSGSLLSWQLEHPNPSLGDSRDCNGCREPHLCVLTTPAPAARTLPAPLRLCQVLEGRADVYLLRSLGDPHRNMYFKATCFEMLCL